MSWNNTLCYSIKESCKKSVLFIINVLIRFLQSPNSENRTCKNFTIRDVTWEQIDFYKINRVPFELMISVLLLRPHTHCVTKVGKRQTHVNNLYQNIVFICSFTQHCFTIVTQSYVNKSTILKQFGRILKQTYNSTSF